jgi:phosphoenolpyruvate-protein phosphotransferase (PTS system enzyme I)
MTDSPRQVVGTPVVPGLAYAPSVHYVPAVDFTSVKPESDREPAAELSRFESAVEVVSARLSERARKASGVAGEVLTASVGLIQDRGLRGAVEQRVNRRETAEHAVVGAVDQFATMFTQLGGLMAERATDIKDIGQRLIAELLGVPEPGLPTLDRPSVLVAEDLAPADTAGLDPTQVVALVTRLGGPTSHTAIIARQLGLPCIVGADIDGLPDGAMLLVDGATGIVEVEPDPGQARTRLAEAEQLRALTDAWHGPGQTSDGHAIAVLANVQDGESARQAAADVAEGIGLFRTELCFLGRDTEPTVDEQAEIYAEVLTAFAGRKVVLRTLDAGSDKPMKFVSLPDEANPALGVRGLRIALADHGLLTRQLDAVAAAVEQTGESPWVMAPMVATEEEAAFFATEVRQRGLTPGVMIEVPAAALFADRLLKVVDFVSIGTNDLAQYTMAADRLAGELASLTDPWQPALLKLISITAQAGAAANKPVGVCGEAAADPHLACVLVGLGVSSLSMARPALRSVGAQLGSVTLEQCRAAAGAALQASDPASARPAVRALLGD